MLKICAEELKEGNMIKIYEKLKYISWNRIHVRTICPLQNSRDRQQECFKPIEVFILDSEITPNPNWAKTTSYIPFTNQHQVNPNIDTKHHSVHSMTSWGNNEQRSKQSLNKGETRYQHQETNDPIPQGSVPSEEFVPSNNTNCQLTVCLLQKCVPTLMLPKRCNLADDFEIEIINIFKDLTDYE